MVRKLLPEVASATAEMYLAGMTLDEVGQVFGISEVAVMKRLQSIGVERRKAGHSRHPATIRFAHLRAGGLKFREIGDTYKIHATSVFNRLRHHKFSLAAWVEMMPFTEEEDDLMHASFFENFLSFPDLIDVVKDHRRLMDQEAQAVEKAKHERKACHLKDHRPTP